MAEDVNDRRSGPWTLNAGQAGPHSFDFAIAAAADLRVTRERAGAETELVLNTDYTVSVSSYPGTGAITLLAAPLAGDKLTLEGLRPIDRAIDDYVSDQLSPAAMNTEGDTGVRDDQELRRDIDRAVRVPRSEDGFAVPALATRQSKFPFNAAGGFALSGYSGDVLDTVIAAVLANSAGATLATLQEAASVAALKALPLVDGGLYLTKTHTAGRDGGLMFWKYAAASTETANDITVVTPSGGTGRFLAITEGVRLTVRHGGAAGDGSTDDTAAIAAMEAVLPGQPIDCLGLTCKVDARPDGARWFNGAWRVGSLAYQLPAQPREHPLDPTTARVLHDNGVTHPWSSALVYDAFRQVFLDIRAEGWRHDAPGESTVDVYISSNGVDGLDKSMTIWSNPGEGVQGSSVAPGLKNGRLSTLILTRVIGGSDFKLWHVWSDEGGGYILGRKWSRHLLATVSGNPPIFPHGDRFDYVNAEGGDDDDGWVQFGYVETGSPGLSVAYTTTNGGASGDEITVALVKAPSGGFTPTEPAVFKRGPGEYIAYCRPSTGSGNLWYSKTATGPLTGWSDWAASNIPCNQNPPNALQADGRAYLFSTSRTSTQVAGGPADALYCTEFDIDDLFENPAAPSPVARRLVYAGKQFAPFYMNFCKTPWGDVIARFLDGESIGLGSDYPQATRVIEMSSRGMARPVASPAIVRARADDPILSNALFSRWDRGSSFTPITSRTPICNRFEISAGGAGVTVTRVDADPKVVRNLPFRSRYALRIQSVDATTSGIVLTQRIFGRDRMARMADKPMAQRLFLHGRCQPYLQTGVVFNYGSGASTSPTAYYSGPFIANTWYGLQDESRDGLWKLPFNLKTPSVESVSWGTNGDEFADIYWLINGAGVTDLTVYGIAATLKDEPEISCWADPDADDERMNAYTHIKRYGPSCMIEHAALIGSSTSGVSTMRFRKQMVQTPTVAVAPGYTFATGLTLPSGTITNSGTGFDQIGRNSCRLVIAGTSLPTGSQELRTTGSDFGILVDVGR